MKIIPAIDIRGGNCVRLLKGNYAEETVYDKDPVVVANEWKKQGAGMIHVVDLDGAKEGYPVNIKTVKKIINEVKIPVQVGGGIRNLNSIKQLIDSGATRIILGTIALENSSLLKEAVDAFGDKIIVALDARGEKLMKRGWIQESNDDLFTKVQELKEIGVRTVMYTDTTRDGTLEGPNYDVIKMLRERTGLNLITAGGITTIEDLKKLQELNIDGVVLGKSLYEKTIDLKEAIHVS